MADTYIHSMADTWNSGGTTYHAIKMDVTDAASAADSRLITLRVGGVDKFFVGKAGDATLQSSDAGATAGPNLTLYRKGGSQANNDLIGKVLFDGEDSAGNQQTYADIVSTVLDTTSTSEDGNMILRTVTAGAMVAVMTLTGAAVTLASNTAIAFAGTGAATTRTNLGLGTIATQDASAVAITGGSYNGTVGATTPSTGAFTTLTTSGSVTMTLADDGATAGPTLTLDRSSASPANNDVIGKVAFLGRDSAANSETYAEIVTQITDTTNGSEDSRLYFYNKVAGSLTAQITLDAAFITTGSVLRGVDGSASAPAYSFSGTTDAGIFKAGTASLGFSAGGSEAMRINTSGQLLIGKTASGITTQGITLQASNGYAEFVFTGAAGSTVIQINRQTNAGTCVNFQYANTTTGNIVNTTTTTAYNTSSDENMKAFKGELAAADAIRIIKADPVRHFDWVRLANGKDMDAPIAAVGWGAQTSYAVSHDLATPGSGKFGEEGYVPWGIDPAKRTPYLWAATSYVLSVIDDHDTRIASLEAENDNLRLRIHVLEAKVA